MKNGTEGIHDYGSRKGLLIMICHDTRTSSINHCSIKSSSVSHSTKLLSSYEPQKLSTCASSCEVVKRSRSCARENLFNRPSIYLSSRSLNVLRTRCPAKEVEICRCRYLMLQSLKRSPLIPSTGRNQSHRPRLSRRLSRQETP